jgi:hypothetical protein
MTDMRITNRLLLLKDPHRQLLLAQQLKQHATRNWMQHDKYYSPPTLFFKLNLGCMIAWLYSAITEHPELRLSKSPAR